MMLGLILLIAGLIIAVIDMFIPTRPSWLLNVAVLLIGLSILVGVETVDL